jgi:hypothetical protein
MVHWRDAVRNAESLVMPFCSFVRGTVCAPSTGTGRAIATGLAIGPRPRRAAGTGGVASGEQLRGQGQYH